MMCMLQELQVIWYFIICMLCKFECGKNLACLLQCNIVCISGKDFKCLCDVRLQDFLILDIFLQISEVIF